MDAVKDLTSTLARELRERPVLGALAAAGGLWAAKQAYDIASFVHLHFLRRSKLDRYKGTAADPAWALITGGSDGIGKGFAEELCSRGFNVILHGRNETKLNVVKDGLLKQWPQREVRLLIIDAGKDAANAEALDAAAKSLESLNLKILVNNVGGVGDVKTTWAPMAERTSHDIGQILDVSARFPTEITRVFLPQLIRRKPALIINIGSGASDIPTAYASIYSGSKAFNKSWSRSLSLEMKGEGHDVEVLCIMVGLVATNATPGREPNGFFTASARGMAKSSLDVVGCGLYEVWAYMPHDLQWAILRYMPKFAVDNFALNIAKNEQAIELKNAKQQ